MEDWRLSSTRVSKDLLSTRYTTNMRILVTKLFQTLRKMMKFGALAVLVILVAFAAFLGYLALARNRPLQLPAPGGPYPVGRVEYNWNEPGKTDPLADPGSGPRKLAIWVWYPAEVTGTTGAASADPAPYLPPAWVQARDQDQGIGVLIETNLSRIQTHSFTGVPLAARPQAFPVLVMEPGMGPMATDYTVLVEALASRGYIVVGINPTYTSNWTVFLDGQVVHRSQKGAIPDSDSPEAADRDGQRILAAWTQDVIFVLDQLEKINTDPASPFNQRLDLQRAGVWGHSFGGATAVAVCQQDPRCKAGVDMDGTPFGETRQAAVPAPFLFITEDYRQGCDRNCELMRQVYEHIQPGAAYWLSVAGAGHFNFSDLPLRQQPAIRPLLALAGYEGSIQPERGLQITSAYLAAFFDQYVKGSLPGPESDLLAGPSPTYPEVTFEKH